MCASFRDRLNLIAGGKRLTDEQIRAVDDNLHHIGLRDCEFTADQVVELIIRKAGKLPPAVIVLDPTYKMLGELKENDSSDMAKLLSKFSRLGKSLNAAVVFATHFPKGNMNKRSSMDRLVGSGVLARNPDAIVTLTELEKNELKKLTELLGGSTAREKKDNAIENRRRTLLSLLSDGPTIGQKAWLDEYGKTPAAPFAGQTTLKNDIKALEAMEHISKSGKGAGVTYCITLKGKEELSRPIDPIPADAEPAGTTMRAGYIHKIEFDLRDNPAQDMFVVKFDEFVHRRIDADLEQLETDSTNEPDPSKDYVVACDGPDDQNYRCTFCDREHGGANEGRETPPGETKRYCRNSLRDSCRLPTSALLGVAFSQSLSQASFFKLWAARNQYETDSEFGKEREKSSEALS